jgi:hypothetical protein
MFLLHWQTLPAHGPGQHNFYNPEVVNDFSKRKYSGFLLPCWFHIWFLALFVQ